VLGPTCRPLSSPEICTSTSNHSFVLCRSQQPLQCREDVPRAPCLHAHFTCRPLPLQLDTLNDINNKYFSVDVRKVGFPIGRFHNLPACRLAGFLPSRSNGSCDRVGAKHGGFGNSSFLLPALHGASSFLGVRLAVTRLAVSRR